MRNHISFALFAAIGLAGGALSHRLGTKIQIAPEVVQTDTSGSEFVPSTGSRFHRFLQWLSTASAVDLEALYGILTDADLFQPADLAMREMVLQHWIALDGRQAYHYAASNHRGDLWELVASPDSIVQRWALSDPVGLLESAVEEPRIDSGVPRALKALVERNPYEAIGHGERLDLDVYSFRSIAKAWATLDPWAAMTWALGLPDADRRRYILPAAFNEAPLDIAIEIALKQRDPYMGAASEFLKRWGEQNPEAAGSWLGHLDHDQRSIRALPFDYWRSSWEPPTGKEFRLDPILVLTALQGLAKHCYEEGWRAGGLEG